MSANPAIEITGLTKVFGTQRALDGIDLAVPEGSIFGFLGPNGAGKTTTLRILTGLARATSGTARILGEDVSALGNRTKNSIGYLPDVPGFYPWMRAREFLAFAGGLFAIPRDVLEERVDALLDMAGLRGVDTRIRGFSRGMKQRLGIAQALVNAPRLLLLDEPTSALDPIGRKDVLDLISSLREKTTVFFSSHILSDVERVCDRVAILNRGRVVMQADVSELETRAGTATIIVEVGNDINRLAHHLEEQPWLKQIERNKSVLRLTVTDVHDAQRAIPHAIAKLDVELRRFETSDVSLEDVFVDVITDRGGDV